MTGEFDARHYERAARRARSERARLASDGPLGLRRLPSATRRILVFTWLGLIFSALYAFFIGSALVQPGYTLADRIASGLLLLGLIFITIHGFGYANSMLKALWGYQELRTRLFVASLAPRVVCVVASFNEPPDVLDETLSAVTALDYPNKEIVLLDDSTREESRQAAREIAERYGVQCVQRTNRRGYKAGAINDYLGSTDAEYIAVFDADALPVSSFLREIVPQLQENPRLGFVQTPQFYANTEVSYVALGSARQQNVFYEYICEGKSYSGAMFCCGTNVLFRRSALVDAGGFDEKSVTEDFATSFNLHRRGWDSLYYNRVFVYSLAPENLAAYFTQQSRWALGTLKMGGTFLRAFLENPRALRAGQWWEYFLSATYYWVGFVNLIFLCLPLATIFFDIKPLRQDVLSYVAIFVPYFLFTLNMFYSGMEARGYRFGETIIGQQMGFLTFPVFVGAGVSALMGKRKAFGVTPKGVSGRVPWAALWPQLLFLALSALALGWGIWLYISGVERSSAAVLINSFWAAYHVWMLWSIFRFNQPVRLEATKKMFFVGQKDEMVTMPPPLQTMEAPFRPGRVARAVGLISALGLAALIGVVAVWNLRPSIPVNVVVVDRTYGPQGQENRAFFWTLNHLRAERQAGFGAAGAGDERPAGAYSPVRDLYGFVPQPRTSDDQKLIYGLDQPLPRELPTPGVVALLDTYGEFLEREPGGALVRHRAQRRGLLPDEITRLEEFATRGGVLVGEWNTIGYPTRPGGFLPPAQLERAIETSRARARSLQANELVRARAAQSTAEATNDPERISRARGRVEDVRGLIQTAQGRTRALQGRRFANAVMARQANAATTLENLLGVRYLGWYGRYVEDFADEAIYDPQLYKNVRDDLRRRTRNAGASPSGPGFVFYPDGPSEIFNPETGELEPSPFARPVAVLEADRATVFTGQLATIVPDPRSADPLLEGVGERVPARYWFDLVTPQNGGKVLASYELSLSVEATQRLQKAGFPARFIAQDGTKITIPALVARRDAQGDLRSLYFAGDASDTTAISSLARQAPALGQLDRLFSRRGGTFASQFYWNYYFPVWENLLSKEQVQYKSEQ